MKTCLPCAIIEVLKLPKVEDCQVCEEKKENNMTPFQEAIRECENHNAALINGGHNYGSVPAAYDVTCPDCQTIYSFNPAKPSTCPGCGTLFTSTTKKEPDKSLSTQIGGTHYMECSIQPVEFITRNQIEFLEGCVIKRMCRHKKKDKLADLKKAIHEIKLLAKLTYNEEI